MSGYFQYYLVAIASDSMKPIINKGDVVVVDKKEQHEELKINDDKAYQNSVGKFHMNVTEKKKTLIYNEKKYLVKFDYNSHYTKYYSFNKTLLRNCFYDKNKISEILDYN